MLRLSIVCLLLLLQSPAHAVSFARTFEIGRAVFRRCSENLGRLAPDRKPISRVEPSAKESMPLPTAEARALAYAQARETFLDGFNFNDRQMARVSLSLLRPGDSARIEILMMKSLTSKMFDWIGDTKHREIASAQYRNLALLLIERSKRFESPEYYLAALQLIADGLLTQKMDSADIARIQIGMIQGADILDHSKRYVQAFAIIFAPRNFEITREDFLKVREAGVVVADLFRFPSDRAAAIEMMDQFAVARENTPVIHRSINRSTPVANVETPADAPVKAQEEKRI